MKNVQRAMDLLDFLKWSCHGLHGRRSFQLVKQEELWNFGCQERDIVESWEEKPPWKPWLAPRGGTN